MALALWAISRATFGRVAKRRHATAAQVAIAWILRQRGVLTIPKSASADHVREHRGALDVQLTYEDLDDLDREFPRRREQRRRGALTT